jgi:hypothetical protein
VCRFERGFGIVASDSTPTAVGNQELPAKLWLTAALHNRLEPTCSFITQRFGEKVTLLRNLGGRV